MANYSKQVPINYSVNATISGTPSPNSGLTLPAANIVVSGNVTVTQLANLLLRIRSNAIGTHTVTVTTVNASGATFTDVITIETPGNPDVIATNIVIGEPYFA